jgi:hypothetical protein
MWQPYRHSPLALFILMQTVAVSADFINFAGRKKNALWTG